MSSSSGTLQFILPTHGNAVLSKMNLLREKHHFCDITLILRGPQGSIVQSVYFHGHKVVLAASSDFLRDQFLLHEGQGELSVGVVSDVNVAQVLLQTCYTGFLQVRFKELVSYLTAASALQMDQVVEKCSQAVSQYLSPILAFLKLEGPSEQKEIQQLNRSRPENSIDTGEEKDAAESNTSIQNTNMQDRGADVTQSNLGVCEEGNMDSQSVSEVREDTTGMKVEVAMSKEEAACCFNTLQSEEIEGIHPLQTSNTLFHAHRTAGTPKCELHPPAILHDFIPPTVATSSASAGNVDLGKSSTNQSEAEEENMHMSVAQVPQGKKERIPDLFCPNAAEEGTGDSYSTFVQRPYLCRRCDKVFQHFKSYVSHLKEHRQISCLVCGQEFSEKSHLRHHISIHTDVKPFRCPLCHKTFIQRATLQDHLDLHTGGRSQESSHSAALLTHRSGVCCSTRERYRESSQHNVLEKTPDCQ